MTHVLAILALALLCAVWVLVQLKSGRGPRTCRGDGACSMDDKGYCGECADGEAEKKPRLVSADRMTQGRSRR